ncbi:hypothetical protein V8D89_002742 [Ganoderma adspersum]
MIRAPLRMLTIRTANPTERGYWTPPALEAFLPNFAPTLETLELCSLYIDIPDARGLDGSSLPPSRSPLTQYTAVRSLSIRILEGVPLLDVLLHQFPALDGTLRLPDWGRNTYLSSNNHIRECNEEAQQRRGDSVWKKLDRLVCDPVLFHLLGLRCPIGLLMIDRGTERTKDDLALALRENPVARLKLSFMLDPGFTVFDSLLYAGLGETLTHLTFCLMDTESTNSFCDAEGMTVTGLKWDDILDRMRSSLEPLQKLTHLRVIFHCNIYYQSSQPIKKSDFTHALGNSKTDLEGVAASLVRLLPALQYVFLTTSAAFGNIHKVMERWQVDRAWRVAEPPSDATGEMHDDRQRLLVDLADTVAATVIVEEELVLSTADEIELQMPEH